MLERTKNKRPDMFAAFTPDKTDEKLLAELERDAKRLVLAEPVSCRQATEDDLESIMLIVRQARNYLKKHRVDQWQDDYPKEEHIRLDMERGELYVVCYGDRVAAFFSLSDKPEKSYESLTDGKWSREEEAYCTLHRCAVGAEFRGSGLSKKMMGFAESIAKAKEIALLRVDTHKRNKAMQALLKDCAFSFRGNITVSVGEGHDNRRQAFDKIL